jgi:PhzF family phenazine biosynthesis protein
VTVPFWQVDAFADRLFAGNPAAVMVLDAWPEDGWMQAAAAENNLSETAFVVREADGWRVRWFTPMVEVDLCGHATLAAGWVVLNRIEPQAE